MSKPETIKIDDVEYVRADANKIAPDLNGMKYSVVRTYSAGVHIGYVAEFGTKHPQYFASGDRRGKHRFAHCS